MSKTPGPSIYQPFQPLLTTQGLQGFGLQLQQSAPCSALAGVVHSYLQITAQRPTPYPVIPDGMCSVFIGPSGCLLLSGQTQAFDLPLPAAGEYFGIRLHPGALSQLFAVDLSEISGEMTDSSFIPCTEFQQLDQQIMQAGSFTARTRLAESWLQNNLRYTANRHFDSALRSIWNSQGNLTIAADLASQTGVTSRHLNRLFQLHTGLSTKAFSRLVRFQFACKNLFSQPSKAAEIAAESGFTDQSHLLKDFRYYLSQTPRQLHKRFWSDFYNL